MVSNVEKNDLDKGEEQLFHYLELRHTERSCRCIQQKCAQLCCSNTERHINEARTSSERQDKHQLTSHDHELRSYCLVRHVTYVQAMLVFKWLQHGNGKFPDIGSNSKYYQISPFYKSQKFVRGILEHPVYIESWCSAQFRKLHILLIRNSLIPTVMLIYTKRIGRSA